MSIKTTNPPVAATSSGQKSDELNDFWLPDFCSTAAARRLASLAILIALILLVAQAPSLWPLPLWDFFLLATLSGAVIAISFALICRWRVAMASWPHLTIGVASVALIMFNLVWLSVLGIYLLDWLQLPLMSFVSNEYSTLARHLIIVALFASLFLRYLALQAQLRIREKTALQARLEALQARIQPHFLFNSMNIIASLIAVDPDKAEQAVEDLATLFRASLRDTVDVSLAEEIALCRRYANIEELRLGDRLAIDWQVGAGVESLRIPHLSLQPLLENAIRHGVELSAVRCDITLKVVCGPEWVDIELTNPVAQGATRSGNQMSLRNVTERLKARFGEQASLQASASNGMFVTRLRYPHGQSPAQQKSRR
ncbi:sensor histidine kinase [Perlucidibaca aquatica]|jgi:two-component system sensor histidine kinase AlgZ|uniref:sensor histidine kinase n=1 Tax=Perlucidibaca aquatica TaxID=1852776 RepID=UPI00083A44DA|nr:histidine kinase [Perlucidibaca aquatica]